MVGDTACCMVKGFEAQEVRGFEEALGGRSLVIRALGVGNLEVGGWG